MDQLHDALDRLFTEVDHLDRIADTDEWGHTRIELALSVVKRIRRDATSTIRVLAQLRDEYES